MSEVGRQARDRFLENYEAEKVPCECGKTSAPNGSAWTHQALTQQLVARHWPKSLGGCVGDLAPPFPACDEDRRALTVLGSVHDELRDVSALLKSILRSVENR